MASSSSVDVFGRTSVSLTSQTSVGWNGIRVDSDVNIAGAGIEAECRICREEDDVKNLESPCGCRGSFKYAHRRCVQSWCDVKGDTMCEICHQPYAKGYQADPRRRRRPRPRPLQAYQSEVEEILGENHPLHTLLGEWGITGSGIIAWAAQGLGGRKWLCMYVVLAMNILQQQDFDCAEVATFYNMAKLAQLQLLQVKFLSVESNLADLEAPLLYHQGLLQNPDHELL